MKYFTPELYLRFNSDDPQEMVQAHDEWERAIERYRQHVREVEANFTPSVRELAHSLCLHDAAVLGLTWVPTPSYASRSLPAPDAARSLVVLTAKQGSTVYFLIYLMAEEPLIHEIQQPWPFSKENAHWLYDEFDVDATGQQRHEVLLSNGRIITLRFHAVQLVTHAVGDKTAVA
jgi:hypothetical protein